MGRIRSSASAKDDAEGSDGVVSPADSNTTARRSRFRLGVLVSDSSEEYQAGIVQGVREVAVAERMILRSFAGGNLGSGRKDDEKRNEIFDLVRPDIVDALVILSGPIGDYCSEEQIARFCKRFQRFPLCTVGDDLPGIPSVRGDN